MASNNNKSVEDMLLCSDIDAVNALVGSLESQLSQPTSSFPGSEGVQNTAASSSSFADNHSSFRTVTNSVQKHGALLGSLLDPGNSSKTYVGPQNAAMNLVPVIASGSGTLHTGNYANNSYGQSPQQTVLNTPAAPNSDGKVMYSLHAAPNLVPTVNTGAANNAQYSRNNFKLHNGQTPTSGGTVLASGGLVRNGTAVCQNNVVNLNSVALVSQPTHSSQSAFQSTLPQLQNPPSQSLILNSLPNTNMQVVKESHVHQNSPQPNNFVQVTQASIKSQPVTFQTMNSLVKNYQTVNSHPTTFQSINSQQTFQAISSQPTTFHTVNPQLATYQTINSDQNSLQTANSPSTFQVVTTQPTFQAINSQPAFQAVTSQPSFQAVTSQPTTFQAVTSQAATFQAVTSQPTTFQTVTSQTMNSQRTFQVVTSQPTNFQTVNSQPIVISTAKSSSPAGTPVNVVAQVISNHPSVQGIRVVNVNQARFGTSSVQRALAPRVVIGNQIQLPSQMIRQGIAVGTAQNGFSFPAGLRGAVFINKGGQLHVVNAGAGTSTAVASTSGAAFRLQSIATRNATPQMLSSGTIIRQAVPVTSLPNGSIVARVGSPSSIAQSQAAAAANTLENVKQKCRNFLTTLVKLAAEQPKSVAINVKKLIQGLIDGTMSPEDFTTKLQKELNSAPQPCLVPFLKKSLPYLRHSLLTKEVVIEGVNPPPRSAHMMASHEQFDQLRMVRPSISATTTTSTVINSLGGSVLTAQLSQPSPVLTNHVLNAPRLAPPVMCQNTPRVSLASSLSSASRLASTASTTFSSFPKPVVTKSFSKATSIVNNKRVAAASSVRDEDDINDVAAMGGVNLVEESQKILATNSELIGTQIRSCKDDNFFLSGTFQNKITLIARKFGLQEVSSEAVALISHAAQYKLKTLIEKVGIVAEHRCTNVKNDPRYEIQSDVKSQIKFLDELGQLEKKKHEEQERETLLRAAKSRSKSEDPEQLKLKQKAKEMQKAEFEELQQREANLTALLAIGPRKRQKMNSGESLNSYGPNLCASIKPLTRPRVKRIHMRDLQFVLEQDRDPSLKTFLYRSYMK